MTYILQHFLKAISILMSPFTDCVIKKGNGKCILRIKSFTDEDTKLIVRCIACRGRKKDHSFNNNECPHARDVRIPAQFR